MNFDKMFKGFELVLREEIMGEIDRYVLRGFYDYDKRLEYDIPKEIDGVSSRLNKRLGQLREYLNSVPLGRKI